MSEKEDGDAVFRDLLDKRMAFALTRVEQDAKDKLEAALYLTGKCAKCRAELPPSPIGAPGDICCRCAGCEHPITEEGK